MAKEFVSDAEDRANFNDRILRFYSLPASVLTKLRSERGQIATDLGIRAAIFYVLTCRVLTRLAHVASGEKQSKAVRRLRVMLTSGIVKKKKMLGRPGSTSKTKDRVLSYVERCVISYLHGDLDATLGGKLDRRILRLEFVRGDALLADVLAILEKSPSLHHVLPMSVLSFVGLIIEMMLCGKPLATDVDGKNFEDFCHEDLYFGLEDMTGWFLTSFHPRSGVVGGGDGRPMFSPSSIFERDGDVAKLAISNVALARALSLGCRMRQASTLRSETDDGEDMTVDTFFAYIIEVLVSKSLDEGEFESVMDEADEVLHKTFSDVIVAQRYLKPFYGVYETLQKCNKVSTLAFKGPGVLSQSKEVPDAVRCRIHRSSDSDPHFFKELVEEVDNDIRRFRRDRNASMDSERVVKRKDGKSIIRYGFSNGEDICRFFYNCVRLAEKLIHEGNLAYGEKRRGTELCDSLRKDIRKRFVLGLFATDLSGNIIGLYEDYIFAFVMRHFDEDEGVRKSLKAATKRRNAARKTKRRNAAGKTKEKRTEVDSDTVQESCEPVGVFDREEEDWAPSSEL